MSLRCDAVLCTLVKLNCLSQESSSSLTITNQGACLALTTCKVVIWPFLPNSRLIFPIEDALCLILVAPLNKHTTVHIPCQERILLYVVRFGWVFSFVTGECSTGLARV
jgi:hypothetical protein